MTHFAQIKFAKTKSHRCKTLSEIMPMGDEWRYFVVLSDAYLSDEAGEIHIQSLSELQRAMSSDDIFQAIRAARNSGKLTEGRHELPVGIISCLARFDSEPLSVRRWLFDASESSTITISTSELAGVWTGPDVDEIEVIDRSANWYFRMKNDEPLIFLAVRAPSLLDQIRQCNAHCVAVSHDFEYAR